MDPIELKQTPLFDFHQALKAKMVPFAGFAMPIQYPPGIKQEHLHTRIQAGLFDVSHMGQFVVSGNNAAAQLEKLIPVDLEALPRMKQTYGLFTNENGGILDDLMISRWNDDTFYLVVNAACKAQDMRHLQAHLKGLEIRSLDDYALLALQGPSAKDVMAKVAPQCKELIFMSACKVKISGFECTISRSGYTGEDGFEISVPAANADALARHLLSFEEVDAIGLGARDTLRLEAGLCLYGHDMNDAITPVEAALTWSIAKSRRPGGNKAGGFAGADAIFRQMAEGVSKKRVGLAIEGRRLIREGAELFDASDRLVGKVTSGGFSPSLDAAIAMGYVQSNLAEIGTELHAMLRDKAIPVRVTNMPFVAQRYKRN